LEGAGEVEDLDAVEDQDAHAPLVHVTTPSGQLVDPAPRSTSAAGFSTTVPLKKSGFTSPQKRTALANMKSRKSSAVMRPCSTSSYASGTTSVMSGTSKCPMSELKIALRRAPSGLARWSKAQALTGSSASQPK